jgi:uncharacterized protein (TIGR02996 family)
MANDDRARFEAALAEDRFDYATRLVFADWLDENGEDAEAAWQRGCTPEWLRAADRLAEFAASISRAGEPVSVEDLVEAGRYFLETGETTVLGYALGMAATNRWYETGVPEEFWDSWFVYTRTPAPKMTPGEPFRCCY